MDAIAGMVMKSPRRWRLKDGWESLKAPAGGTDWSLRFPFVETFENLASSCPKRHIGIKQGNGRPYTFLKCQESELDDVRRWLDVLGSFVAIRDCLALSFALDYDREGGDPSRPQTAIGRLRSEAKPYDRPPSATHFAAMVQLKGACVEFLSKMPCYSMAEVLVPMPSSNPTKDYDLPLLLAREIAKEAGMPTFAQAATTVQHRHQMKNVPVAQKLQTLSGTISVDRGPVAGRTILLIDDLYQSGVSMNYVGMLLLGAGAKAVFGLAVEKTCRNDDNVKAGGPP